MPKEKKEKPLKLIDALKVVADEDISDSKNCQVVERSSKFD